jgi:hypothetical protein
MMNKSRFTVCHITIIAKKKRNIMRFEKLGFTLFVLVHVLASWRIRLDLLNHIRRSTRG